MSYFTLLNIQDKTIHFCDSSGNGIVFRAQACQLIRGGLIEFFHLTDAKKIVTASEIPGSFLTRLVGTSVYVPMSRLYFLPLFAVMLGMVLMTAYPLAAKITVIFGLEISAMHVIFPLGFIITDLINEFFGYQMAKRVILFTGMGILICAAFIQIAVLLKTSHGSYEMSVDLGESLESINSSFHITYAGLPKYLLFDAISLIVSDLFNAFIFTHIRHFLRGKQLWLRSLVSNTASQIAYTLIFSTLLQLYTLIRFGHATTTSYIFPTLGFKFVYFIAAIPLIYAIRYYISNQELKLLRAEMRTA